MVVSYLYPHFYQMYRKYTLEYAETLHMDFKLDKTCKTYFFPPLLIKVTY